MWHSSPSTKQQRRRLPSLLSLSFFYEPGQPRVYEKLSFRKSRFNLFQFHFNALGVSCGVNWTFGGSGSVHQVIISNNQTGVCTLDRISL